jgi:hypothetical protein
VHVQEAVRSQVQHRLGQDQPIGRDDADLRSERRQLRLRITLAQRHGRADRHAQRLRATLDGGGDQFAPAPPAGARRLAVRRDHVVPRLDQRVERGHREVGRPHEDDAHGGALKGSVPQHKRIPGESRGPEPQTVHFRLWTPAFAGEGRLVGWGGVCLQQPLSCDQWPPPRSRR